MSTRPHLIVGPLAGILLFLLCGCGGSSSAPAAGAGRAPRIPKVVTATVESRILSYTMRAVGSLDAYDWVTIPARVEGPIERLSLEEGDLVSPAKVLAVINGERFALEAAQADATAKRSAAAVTRVEAQVADAAASLAEARGNLERREALRAKKLVSEEEYASFQAQVARLEASLAAAGAAVAEAKAAVLEAEAHVALAKKNQADSEVRSPIAGRVEQKHVSEGQYVKVGAEIAMVADLRSLRLRFRVTEAESARVTTKLTVAFTVRALPGRTFHAAVFHVSASADPATRMVECLATVTDADPALKPGFFAEVTVATKADAASVVVPEDAVLPTEQGTVAFTVVDGRARIRPVSIGMRTRSGDVEVLSGLAPGEALVVKGAGVLVDGQAVEVVVPPPAPAAGAPR